MHGTKGENQKLQTDESGRPKRPKVNGPKNSLLTVQKDYKWPVQKAKSEQSKRLILNGSEIKNERLRESK